MQNRFKKPFIPLIISLGKRFEKRKFIDPPILIGGCGRSGTTILLSVISAHPEIYCFPKELGAFSGSKTDKSGHSVPGRIDRLYTAMLINKIPATARRWCEKSPNNITQFSHINAYFKGRFRFIQIIRDGRDVILSRHPKKKDDYWVSPERWIKDVHAGLEIKDHENVFTIKYEDLIMEFEETISGICNFLNVPLSREIFNWYDHATVRQNKALFQDVQRLNSNSIGKWQAEENQVRVKELTEDPEGSKLLMQLGYL